jgi:hypothetical protein
VAWAAWAAARAAVWAAEEAARAAEAAAEEAKPINFTSFAEWACSDE